jgi:hypothetical protein
MLTIVRIVSYVLARPIHYGDLLVWDGVVYYPD